eukprot:TRINITY_DN933_c0_g1_i2.p1 TRINITY_DN933_c0_g1~~TRINITY_DN933_c0_g1_i2.p1  ORF type:complete len:203 (-),score=35.97 TRINITY_DN933_c0_g1_i2:105-713(-)
MLLMLLLAVAFVVIVKRSSRRRRLALRCWRPLRWSTRRRNSSSLCRRLGCWTSCRGRKGARSLVGARSRCHGRVAAAGPACYRRRLAGGNGRRGLLLLVGSSSSSLLGSLVGSLLAFGLVGVDVQPVAGGVEQVLVQPLGQLGRVDHRLHSTAPHAATRYTHDTAAAAAHRSLVRSCPRVDAWLPVVQVFAVLIACTRQRSI